jgi:hypothetical protein
MQLRTLGALALFVLGGSFGSGGCETHKAGSGELGEPPAPPPAVAAAKPAEAPPDEARPPTEPPPEKLPTDAVDVVPAGGPSCDDAADSVMKIIESQVKKQSPEQLPMFQSQKDQLRAQFVGQCNADNWTAEAKNCVMKAKNEADLQPCQALLPNKQNDPPAPPNAPPAPPGAPPAAPAPPPVATAPVDRGGPPCDQVARNVVALLEQAQDVPPEQREPLHGNINGMCANGGWSRKVKECFAVAKRAADLTECQRYADVEARAQQPQR